MAGSQSHHAQDDAAQAAMAMMAVGMPLLSVVAVVG